MGSRRDFLKQTAVAGGAALVGAAPISSLLAQASRTAHAAAPLDLLILGGTGFIGPHIVRHAVARGHRVTIFTRGRRDADLPQSVIRLVGDRDGQLGALEGKRWDAVIDDSATNPDWVRLSTQVLRSSGRYLFTSSTGVYYPYLRRGVDESVPPRLDMDDPNDGSASYGTRKARCEQITQEVFGDRALVVRPTYIVGPGDTTDRFPYWPVRLARGGEVLVPGRRDDPVQIIDVRDLAEFMVRLHEEAKSGVYNVAGPAETLTMPVFINAARDALNANVQLTHVDDYVFLREHKITYSVPWVMLEGKNEGHTSVRYERAKAAGLTYRPLATTVRDTLSWWQTVPEERRSKPRFAITAEQETAALAAWKARKRS